MTSINACTRLVETRKQIMFSRALLHVSDVMYCSKWQLKKARRLKHYQKTKLGKTKEHTSEECQDFCERVVCVSEFANWQ